MSLSTEQLLVKHGDVVTLRTQNEQGGFLYIDRNTGSPEVAHDVALPITDRRFDFQIHKPTPQRGGGNQNPDYVTEGDQIILKSIDNNLVLTLHGNHCGFNTARANLGLEIAVAHYQAAGDGSHSAMQVIASDGSITHNQGAVKGHKAYALKFTQSGCYLSMPHAQQGITSGGHGLSNNFLILPASGTMEELQFQPQGPVDLDSAQDAGYGQYEPPTASAMAISLGPVHGPAPGGDDRDIIFAVVIGAIILALGVGFFFYTRKGNGGQK